MRSVSRLLHRSAPTIQRGIQPTLQRFTHSQSRQQGAGHWLTPGMMMASLAGGLGAAGWMSQAKYEAVELKDKVVLITGATAGIGEACARRFAEEGCKLVLVGRRTDRLKKLKASLEKDFPQCSVHIEALDVRDEKRIMSLPRTMPAAYRNVDILVNNAGLALGTSSVDKNAISDARQVIDTNVIGVIAFCSAFIPGMKERGQGHLINMGSIAGHIAYPNGTVYNASKFAVNGFTTAARHDLVGTPIRVTHISPGAVQTEFSVVRFKGDNSKADAVYHDLVPLNADDIADNVLYAATRPAHVQIADIVVFCTNQSSPVNLSRQGDSLGAKVSK